MPPELDETNVVLPEKWLSTAVAPAMKVFA